MFVPKEKLAESPLNDISTDGVTDTVVCPYAKAMYAFCRYPPLDDGFTDTFTVPVFAYNVLVVDDFVICIFDLA